MKNKLINGDDGTQLVVRIHQCLTNTSHFQIQSLREILVLRPLVDEQEEMFFEPE